MYCTSPFLTENAGKIEPKCHSATLHTFAITYKCFRKSFIERNIQYAYEIGIFPQGVADTPLAQTDGFLWRRTYALRPERVKLYCSLRVKLAVD